MDNWHVISTLLVQMTQLVQAGATTLLGSAVGYALPFVIKAAIVWIAAMAVAVAFDAARPNAIMHGIFRIAVVIAVLQSVATYNQWVGDVAQTLPNEVANALSGATGNITTGQAFDHVLNSAFKAGLVVWQGIPMLSLVGPFLALIVIFYWSGAIICVGTAAVIYGASTILLILFIKTGPLFLALFAFPQTRRFGNGWVSAMASAGLAQVLAVAILVLMLGAKQAMMDQVVTAAQDGGLPNFVYSIISLLLSDFALFVLWYLLKQATSFAGTIAGGVYHNVGHITAMLPAAPTAAHQTQTALTMAAGAARGGVAAAQTVAGAIRAARVGKMVGGVAGGGKGVS